MARPRTIDPDGHTERLTTLVPSEVRRFIDDLAAERGTTLAQVMREIIEAGIEHTAGEKDKAPK